MVTTYTELKVTLSTVTATEGIVIKCTKCGNVLFSAQAGALKSSALLQCPSCHKNRVVRPAYMIQKETE